jgi:hypothetical protein
MHTKILLTALIAVAAAGCSSQSAVLTNDSGQAVKCENWGFGVIGAPVAMASQSDCVKKANEAGYHEAGKPTGNASTATAQSAKASPTAGSLGLAFPDGWQQKPPTDVQRRAGTAITADNITTDSHAVVLARELQGITDRDAYIVSRRAAMESHLKDSTHSDIVAISINGRPAKQYQVTGTGADGARATYLSTWIFGQSQVVLVHAWTSAPNFDSQHAALQALAERVSGIQ